MTEGMGAKIALAGLGLIGLFGVLVLAPTFFQFLAPFQAAFLNETVSTGNVAGDWVMRFLGAMMGVLGILFLVSLVVLPIIRKRGD